MPYTNLTVTITPASRRSVRSKYLYLRDAPTRAHAPYRSHETAVLHHVPTRCPSRRCCTRSTLLMTSARWAASVAGGAVLRAEMLSVFQRVMARVPATVQRIGAPLLLLLVGAAGRDTVESAVHRASFKTVVAASLLRMASRAPLPHRLHCTRYCLHHRRRSNTCHITNLL